MLHLGQEKDSKGCASLQFGHDLRDAAPADVLYARRVKAKGMCCLDGSRAVAARTDAGLLEEIASVRMATDFRDAVRMAFDATGRTAARVIPTAIMIRR